MKTNKHFPPPAVTAAAVPGAAVSPARITPAGVVPGLLAHGVAAVLLLGGCASPVPGTRISGQIGGKPFEFNSPKQMSLEGFTLAHTTGTNTFTLTIGKMSSTNDPQVIDKAYAGQAAVAKTYFDGVNQLASKLAEGGAKGANPVK